MNKFIKMLTVAILAVVTALTCFACATPDKTADDPGLYYKKTTSGDYLIYKYVDDGEKTELDIGAELSAIADELATGEVGVTIHTNTFNKNATLTKIIVPETVTEIQAGAFAGMRKLKELVVPFIGKTANALTEFSPEEAEDLSVGSERTIAHFFSGVEKYKGSTAVSVNYDSAEGSAVEFFIPLSFNKLVVKNTFTEYSVPMYAFNGLAKLVNVEFDCNLVAIGEYAFANVVQLETFNIPDSVKTIYKGAFSGSNRLANVVYSSNSVLETIGDNAFENTAISSFEVKATVKSIGDSAFKNSKLTTLTIATGSEELSIANHAFMNCAKLEKVIVERNVDLGNYAFSDCTALKTFGASTLADYTIDIANVTDIGSQAFGYLGEKDEDPTYTVVNSSAFASILSNVFFGSKIA